MTKRKVLAVVSACALLRLCFVSLIQVHAGKPDDTTGGRLVRAARYPATPIMAGR